MKITLGSSSEMDNLVTSNGSSTPSTPGPSSAGQHFTDEPIHIINVSLKCEDLEHMNDAELSTKCRLYVQVSIICDIHYSY